jgi:hypothetical protein
MRCVAGRFRDNRYPPAFFRLFLKLVMGFAHDNRLRATWRTMAMLSGELALRNRVRSTRNTMSSIQGRRCSNPVAIENLIRPGAKA